MYLLSKLWDMVLHVPSKKGDSFLIMSRDELTNEQLVELIQNGIEKNQNVSTLYKKNKALISHYLKPFWGKLSKEDFEDIEQNAFFALLQAAENYDFSRDAKFSTCLKFYVKTYTLRYLRENKRSIRIPVYLSQEMSRYNKFVSDFVKKNGYEPTDDEVLKKLKINKQTLKAIKKNLNDTVSYNVIISEEIDTQTEMIDMLEDPNVNIERDVLEQIYRDNLTRVMHDVLNHYLTPAQRDAVIMYFFNGQTQDYIAKKLNVSHSRAQQLIKESINKIKKCRALRIIEDAADIEAKLYAKNTSNFYNTWYSPTESAAIDLYKLSQYQTNSKVL